MILIVLSICILNRVLIRVIRIEPYKSNWMTRAICDKKLDSDSEMIDETI